MEAVGGCRRGGIGLEREPSAGGRLPRWARRRASTRARRPDVESPRRRQRETIVAFLAVSRLRRNSSSVADMTGDEERAESKSEPFEMPQGANRSTQAVSDQLAA